MVPVNDFTLGEHSASIDLLLKGQDDIYKRLGEIERALNIRAGERAGIKFVAAAIAFLTSVGSTLVALFATGKL